MQLAFELLPGPVRDRAHGIHTDCDVGKEVQTMVSEARALASIRHLKSGPNARATRHQYRVASVCRRPDAVGIPHLDNPSRIVAVIVCGPVLCKQISDRPIDEFVIDEQPISCPNVARGSERLCVTPSPLHTDANIDHLVAALSTIWSELSLRRAA